MKIANAIILAGGRNSRMGPLAPKAALPVVNRPNIRWTMENLHESGVSNFIVATSYGKVADLAREGRNPSARSINIFFESQPMGTATVTKLCCFTFNFEPKLPFYAVAADISHPTMNFKKFALAFEEAKESYRRILGAVAFAVRPYDEIINRYPVAIIDENNLITKFVEKPKSPAEAYKIFKQIKAPYIKEISDQLKVPCLPINSSYYILQPKIFDLVPEPNALSNYDFGKILFKRIPPRIFSAYFIPEKTRNRVPKVKKEWIDMASPSDYWLANWLFIKTAAKKIFKNYDHQNNLCLGQNVYISPLAKVTDSILGDNVTIGDHCEIRHSIIGNLVQLKEAKISRSIILSQTHILDPQVTIENSIIGGNTPMIVRQLGINCPNRQLVTSLANGEIVILPLNLKAEDLSLCEDSFKKLKFYNKSQDK